MKCYDYQSQNEAQKTEREHPHPSEILPNIVTHVTRTGNGRCSLVLVSRWISNLNSRDGDFSSACLSTFTFPLVIAARGYLAGHRAGSSKALLSRLQED